MVPSSGLSTGAIFTCLALVVLWLGLRFRQGWRRAALTLVLAALAAAPNLLTLGIVIGDGNAAHAGERILDVDGPGFRGGSLLGAILGGLLAVTATFLAFSRQRNKRRAKDFKSELDSQ